MYALAPNTMSLSIGSTVGSWTVEDELGRGAMAIVYRVRSDELGTARALKVLERTDDETEARLLAEGRAQAAIDHPGVIQVLDVLRTSDGRAALLMELVEGSDLTDVLREGPLEIDTALGLFRQVLDAVQAAHDADLIHRDLKPGNILIGDDGKARVGDFGLVKHQTSDATATRALLGTPRYMAPEQMRSARRIDARADVFALGCVLFEMVCGRPAFPGNDLVDLYTAKSGNAYADPSVLNPAIPPEVRRAILGALEGSATRRIPSCTMFKAVLDGAPWPADERATQTLDDASLTTWRCPACSAVVETDTCEACGAPTLLGGRYQLVEVLSSRGQTRTYRALDLQDGQWVVARGLAHTASADVKERFRRGVETLATLKHPQLPRIAAELFDEADRTWEIREYISGSSLADELSETRMGEREVLEVMLDLVPVLAYLHDRSPPVVHRALTADNVIRASDGRLVLTDFSNVREHLQDPQLGGWTFDGVFGAMAPEQYRGDASPASDVYGMGTLAVGLLSRQPLAALQSMDGLKWNQAIQVSERTAGLLDELLAADPELRPDIRAVGRRATGILSGELVVAEQPVARSRALWALPVAGVAVMGLSAALVTVSAVALWPTARESEAYAAAEEVFSGGVQLEEQPAIFAEREFPRANCDSTPFTARVEIPSPRSDEPIALDFTPNCARDPIHLGTFPVNQVVELELPSAGHLRASWVSTRCVNDGELRPCTLSSDLSETSVRFAKEMRELDVRVVDQDGAPIPEATLGWSNTPATRTADSDGQVHFPRWKSHGTERAWMWRVDVDGVGRHVNRVEGGGPLTLVVDTRAGSVSGRVTDDQGTPVAHASVECGATPATADVDSFTLRHKAEASMHGVSTVTDAEGRYGCAPLPKDDYAIGVRVEPIDHENVTELFEVGTVNADIQVESGRKVLVACAGLTEDRCEQVDNSAMCREVSDAEGLRGSRCYKATAFDGTSELRCTCDPEHAAVQVAGRGTLLGESDEVWVDFRDITGGVQGRVPDPEVNRDRCLVALYGRGFGHMRSVQTDQDGRYQFDGLSPGMWRVQALCDGEQSMMDVRVDQDIVRADFE